MLLSSKLPGVAHKCFLELGSWPATNSLVGPAGIRLPPPVLGDLVLFKGPTKMKNSPDERSPQCYVTTPDSSRSQEVREWESLTAFDGGDIQVGHLTLKVLRRIGHRNL